MKSDQIATMSNTLSLATPETYEEQLNEKIALTKKEFEPFYRGDLDVFRSPSSHFRMRAEFKIWHDDDTASYAMYEKGEYKKAVKIKEFTLGSKKINELMPKLLKEVNSDEVLRNRLFQAEFLTTTTSDCLITLIYRHTLTDAWEKAANRLSRHLDCKIIGRSRKQKVVLNEDYVWESFTLANGKYHYQQIETGFTQPNAHVCIDMLNWATHNTKNLDGDLLELYCGNGNFTLPLSKNFRRVLATEVSKISIQSARTNMNRNNITNIDLVRMSSEEFTQAYRREREFRRLKSMNLDNYKFTTLFVDPPRAGLDPQTEKFASQFENIVYISCNPSTLRNNLVTLSQTHTVKTMALFDQFPYTEHRECGVILQRK